MLLLATLGRYILKGLYVAVIWIISRLIIYIDQLNAGILLFEIRKNLDLRKILATPKIFLKSRFNCNLSSALNLGKAQVLGALAAVAALYRN